MIATVGVRPLTLNEVFKTGEQSLVAIHDVWWIACTIFGVT